MNWFTRANAAPKQAEDKLGKDGERRVSSWFSKYASDSAKRDDGDFYTNHDIHRVLGSVRKLLANSQSVFSLELFEKILEKREITRATEIGNWFVDFIVFEETRDELRNKGTLNEAQIRELNALVGGG